MRTVMDLRTIGDRFPGIGRYAYNLARALVRRKNRPELVLISNPGTASTRYNLASLAWETDVRIVAVDARPFTVREQTLLPILLRRLAPNLAHFPSWIMPWAAPRPFVVTIHDIIPLLLPQYFTAGRRMLYRASLAFSFRHATSVICLSEATRADLETIFPRIRGRLSVIPAGVERSFRPSTKAESEPVRAKYALPEQYLLYVGSNKPHKNLPALVEAYARLGRAPALLLAGMEDLRYPGARQRIETLGLKDRVRVMGQIPEEDLPRLYSNALAFIFPSLYEGFGLPPLEAMASGAPAACSDIPSLRETTGGAALLFDARNLDAITSALDRMIRDEELRAALRVRGLRRAAELTWDLAAGKVLDVYHQVC